MISYMVRKLAPNPTHFTRGLVTYVPGRGYFRAVPSQNGDKFVTSPPPLNRRTGCAIIESERKEKIGSAWSNGVCVCVCVCVCVYLLNCT